MIIATIKGVEVTQDSSGVVDWGSGAAIDADGSNGQNGGPFAYRIDDTGLDALENAGYPAGGWTNVFWNDGAGGPLADPAGNIYSKTSYVWPGTRIAWRSIDAWRVPYVVVNPHVRLNAAGVIMGCRAVVTFRGKSIEAVVGDVGEARAIGEISIAAALMLGIPHSARDGGTDEPVNFKLYPGTAAFVQGVRYHLQPA